MILFSQLAEDIRAKGEGIFIYLFFFNNTI